MVALVAATVELGVVEGAVQEFLVALPLYVAAIGVGVVSEEDIARACVPVTGCQRQLRNPNPFMSREKA